MSEVLYAANLINILMQTYAISYAISFCYLMLYPIALSYAIISDIFTVFLSYYLLDNS